jgi:acyl-CoA ligase (AMP-forming) (exosortase A-associated)
MEFLLSDLIRASALATPKSPAIQHGELTLDYQSLENLVERTAAGFIRAGLGRGERVAVYLPKQVEFVAAVFGAVRAGGVFVPVNPVLKHAQVGHILRDCNVRILVTSCARLQTLAAEFARCPDLRCVVLIDTVPGTPDPELPDLEFVSWERLQEDDGVGFHRAIDTDMAGILYTSGSTGLPKGVVLSHRNMVAGARSVAGYLENHRNDRILAVLPFSFDAGFSQLTTAFVAGACTVMLDYLLPKDVVASLQRERITGMTGVPPLWVQLTQRDWPESITMHLRYIANTGGAMPRATLARLRQMLPETKTYLMYGLTEAFRSTYLPPEELDRRPGSMGKAIPNAEVMVVRENGKLCAPDEPGELVHRGALVAMGYWNDPERTAQRFKPAPGQATGIPIPEIAVWSGDTVKMDADGYLYFVGRRDDMIKTSGYRVSAAEIEEVLYSSGAVAEAAVVGVPHPALGQAVVVVGVARQGADQASDAVIQACTRNLPAFMVPQHVDWRDSLPRNPNGKIDRKQLADQLADLFQDIEI